jgi:hypothetical protein
VTYDHTASGSALGYLFQVERALLELIRRSDETPLSLFMERLDDFELETARSALEILQTKHHVGASGDLSDMSVDLWRSIGVWVDVVSHTPGLGQVALVLLTTSSVPPGTAASHLQETGRDTDLALSILEEAARRSSNHATAGARSAFLALDPAERARLISSVRIHAAQTGIAIVDDEIASALRLRLSLAPAFHEAFVERLKGWWYRESVRMLSEPEAGITADDLVRFLQQLRDTFHPEDLPLTIEFVNPTDSELASYRSEFFVAQLEWIAYSNKQLLIAIRDYHRAFAERSRWAREGILRPGELDEYEKRLVDQWQRVFEDMVSELAGSSEEDRQRAGRLLLQRLRDSTAVTLRPRYAEVFLTHGTLHGLANRSMVGWHPDFETRLESLLLGSAE